MPVIALLLAAAQIGSPARTEALRQSVPGATDIVLRKPVASHCAPVVAPGHSHAYASIPLTLPPFVNAETIRMSPSVWWPVHAVVPPGDSQLASACRNQKAMFASPVLTFRSRPK